MFYFSLNLNIERAVFLCYYIECIIIVKGIGNITLSTGPFFLVMYFIYIYFFLISGTLMMTKVMMGNYFSEQVHTVGD